jgi:hypothetical protein
MAGSSLSMVRHEPQTFTIFCKRLHNSLKKLVLVFSALSAYIGKTWTAILLYKCASVCKFGISIKNYANAVNSEFPIPLLYSPAKERYTL